jgi:phospholipase A1
MRRGPPALVLIAAAVLLCAAPPDAGGQDAPPGAGEAPAATSDLVRCARIEDPAERLACYDSLAESVATRSAEPGAGALLSERWELRGHEKQGTMLFRPHRPNYVLLGRYSDAPNQVPYSPTRLAAPPQQLKEVEAKYQLSFKVKALEGLFGRGVDVWIAYTQQSSWQVYNRVISRPFRETDYEPEVMVLIPTRYPLLGLRGRFINLGLAHQSNGRSNPLSRSWNRVYAQVALDRGPFVLMVRPWLRISEDPADDDNPDIEDYLGYGDLVGLLRWRSSTLAVTVRNNFASRPNRGSLELDWTVPLHPRLRGYVQLFSGCGESLIDYNPRQTTIGVGLLLTDWL